MNTLKYLSSSVNLAPFSTPALRRRRQVVMMSGLAVDKSGLRAVETWNALAPQHRSSSARPVDYHNVAQLSLFSRTCIGIEPVASDCRQLLICCTLGLHYFCVIYTALFHHLIL